MSPLQSLASHQGRQAKTDLFVLFLGLRFSNSSLRHSSALHTLVVEEQSSLMGPSSFHSLAKQMECEPQSCFEASR